MAEISLRLSPKSLYHWEEVIPGPDTFEAYMKCFSGCANKDDSGTYTELLLQRLAPYCTHKDWMNYWCYGYSGLEEIDKEHNLRLTATEKNLLDINAASLRFTEYLVDIDRISKGSEKWNLPFSPLDLRRKILNDLADIRHAYKEVRGVEIKPQLSQELSSKFDRLLAPFVEKGIIVIEK